MNILIVDNEAPLREALHEMLQRILTQPHRIDMADGVQSGLSALNTNHYDIVFLDVEMDDGTGFDVLAGVEHPDFQVVFVTAHQHYALDAFRCSAIDYLLKPVVPDELRRSIQRAEDTIALKSRVEQLAVLREGLETKPYHEKRLVLRDHDAIHFVKVADIIILEAQTGYTKFFLQGGGTLVVSKTMKEYEHILTAYGFVRTHHSYIVNAHHIIRFDKADGGRIVTDGGIVVPVSQRKRDAILKILSNQ